jgi:hypothetical protein
LSNEGGKAKQLDGDYMRDEKEQAPEIIDLLKIFERKTSIPGS